MRERERWGEEGRGGEATVDERRGGGAMVQQRVKASMRTSIAAPVTRIVGYTGFGRSRSSGVGIHAQEYNRERYFIYMFP